MAASIIVVVANPALRAALATALRLSGSVQCHGSIEAAPFDLPGAVFVVTSADCLPEQCAAIASSRAAVIVLSALSRPGERQHYLDAGAAEFLPIPVPFHELVAVVRRAMPIAASEAQPVAAHADRQ